MTLSVKIAQHQCRLHGVEQLDTEKGAKRSSLRFVRGRSSLAMFRLFTNEGGRGGEELTVHGEATYLEMIEAEIRKVLSFLVRTTVKDAHC